MNGHASGVEGRFLVVSSSSELRQVVRRGLHGLGAVVDTARTDRQALHRVLRARYAVILCELTSPPERTYALIDQIAQQGSAALFILVANSAAPEAAPPRQDARIVGVLSHPSEDGELAELVQRASELARQLCPSSIAPTSSLPPGPVLVLGGSQEQSLALRRCIEAAANGPCEVHATARTHEALELLSQRRCSFALVSLNLPDAPGLDSTRLLHAADPNLPILVVAGQPLNLAYQALACGAQEVVDGARLATDFGPALERALLRKTADREVRYRALHDPLTGLANRARFVDSLERALARQRRQGNALCVVYIDLDGFKPINDELGHAAGDAVLREVANRLKQSLRECDLAARLGGDEFALLLEGGAERASMRPIAQRILRNLTQPIAFGEGEVRVAASLGVTICDPGRASSVSTIMDAADTAMFEAKDAGGNQYCFSSDASGRTGQHGDRIGAELEKSVVDTDYFLMFQPQVDLGTHGIVGLEALLRWRRGREEGIGPAEFVPVLERTGLIVDVGAWVLREACASASAWATRHGRQVRIAVNVSPLQLERGNFVAYVEQVLKDAQVSPRQLELEITETTLMRDTGHIQRTLAALRELGVRIVLDDFGTGYASLSYLRRYPVDGLKIDRSFTSTLLQEHVSRVLVGSIIDLAHQLDMSVVAEGVEQLPQVRYLRDRGCDSCQGFLFGRPHFLGDTRSAALGSIPAPAPANTNVPERKTIVA